MNSYEELKRQVSNLQEQTKNEGAATRALVHDAAREMERGNRQRHQETMDGIKADGKATRALARDGFRESERANRARHQETLDGIEATRGEIRGLAGMLGGISLFQTIIPVLIAIVAAVLSWFKVRPELMTWCANAVDDSGNAIADFTSNGLVVINTMDAHDAFVGNMFSVFAVAVIALLVWFVIDWAWSAIATANANRRNRV